MNRVHPKLVSLITLLASVNLLNICSNADAQGGFRPGGRTNRGKPVIGYPKMPSEVMQHPMKPGTKGVGRAGKPVTAQTIIITPNTPLTNEKRANWARDEQTVVFMSDRLDLQGTSAGTAFHLYRCRPDGSGLEALTGPLATPAIRANSSQADASYNGGSSSVVYVDTDSSGGVDLREFNLLTKADSSILKTNIQGWAFNSLNRPQYGFSVGGNTGVLFSGRRDNDTVHHLYTIDITSANITQITSGLFDDRNPTLSPDPQKPVIIFDRGVASGAAPRDIWVIAASSTVSNPVKVTNFSAGGKASDNREPSWSTNKTDNPGNGFPIVGGQQLIAFASSRYDTANDGNANGVNPNGSHDIYWLMVTVAPDPNNSGVFTITTPESTNNPALKLVTSDKQHIYDDRNPTWPQFINTYRVIYESDRTKYDPIADANGLNASGPAGQPTDLFASTLFDLNAPTLVRFNEGTGDILDVTPRISNPGGSVKITAKLADFETGIRDVWVQIKNPNSKYQSSDNKEHKVYLTFGLSADGSNLDGPSPMEYDMERIFIGDGSGGGTPGTYAPPRYTASVDDFYAFSGRFSPPEPAWLQLQFVSRDVNTGISTFAANWTTDGYPSDYVIDVIAYDNAVNPFSPNERNNWRIYDNIWGFTTQAFQASHGILFVSDHSEGQKFFASRFNNTAVVNVSYSFWGTESWMTDMDVNLFPTSWVPKAGGTAYPLVGIENALGVRSYGSLTEISVLTYDYLTDDGSTSSDGQSYPVTQQYDIWRITCRGPVPDSVLQQYTPHFEPQPPDTTAGETTTRQVLVAPRCVIWHSPYSGGLFVGSGSITDLNVQNQLHNFLAAGGRMLVNGQDIGWALTLDKTATNAFYSGDLRANYIDDQTPGASTIVLSGGGFPAFYYVSPNYALQTSGRYNPITHDPWRNTIPPKLSELNPGHIYGGDGGVITDYISNGTRYLLGGTDDPTSRTYGSLGIIYPDQITPLNATVSSDMRYANGNSLLIHYADPTTGQRVAYFSGGMEGLIPDEYALPSPPFPPNWHAHKNRRSELLHNMVCWFRTGTIFGKVIDTEGGAPIADALVRLYNRATPAGVPITAYTAVTKSDGSYEVNGVEPDDYSISAVKPGYSFQKRTAMHVHGGFRADMSFRMTRAEPTVIKGKLTRLDGTTPVVGGTVTAKDNLNATAQLLTATSDVNGNYSFDRAPSQTTYTLTATAVGYGESIPKSILVQDPADPSGQNLLQPATTYPGNDFKLKPIPGSVNGFVYVKNTDGTKGAPIGNATVTATSGTTTVTAVTDANGAYSFNELNSPPNGLDPGAWNLTATAPGYAPNVPATSVTVITNQNVVAEDILLSAVAPGSVSGLVTRSSDGAAIPGVLIQLKDSNGNVVTSTTTVTAQTDSAGYRYNYRIANAPAGVTYTVVASRNGFTASPVSRPAAVTSGTETKNINFVMEPLHTFSANLSLVSAPYDYSAYDPVNDVTGQGGLLDVPQSDVQNGSFLFASWDLGRYVFYPTPPANTFHLGRGYFLGYKQNLPLSVQGTAADTTRPFDIALNSGWNMVGDPFPFDIDWTKVHFVDGGVVKTYSEAVSSGAIGSALYSYISGTYVLSFRIQPWTGYWLRAYRNVVLRIDPTTDKLNRSVAIAGGTSRAIQQGGTGWNVNLRVKVADTVDEDNHLGVSSRAADGFDSFKLEKPPVFGKRYSYLSFSHPTWGDKSGSYGVDIRSATTGTKTWEFEVQTTIANAAATLNWPNVATAPRGTTLTITDLSTNTAKDMRTTSSYSWNTGEKAATRKFRIESAPGTNNTLKVTDVFARQIGRSSAVGVSFNLSQAANVEVRIVGATGAQVRRLSGRASRAAGINELTWDGKSDQNVSVPSGNYLVQVRAQSADGKSTVHQVAPVIIVR